MKTSEIEKIYKRSKDINFKSSWITTTQCRRIIKTLFDERKRNKRLVAKLDTAE